MALHWDVSKVVENNEYPKWVKGVELPMGGFRYPRENETEKVEDFLAPRLNAIIWAMLVVGLGSITEKNWKKFYQRLWIYEKVMGPVIEIPYTAKEIKAYIGLSTNVSTESDAAFFKKVKRWNTEAVAHEMKDL